MGQYNVMNAVNPLTQISAQLSYIEDSVLEYFASLVGNSGNTSVASNLFELWNQSQQNSQGPMAYVCYMGETPWSSDKNIADVTHRVKRDWVVRVKQGRGYTSDRGQTAIQFSTVVEGVRDCIRSLQGLSQDLAISFSGIKPVRLGDQVIDCYDIAFSTMNDLPPITTTTGQ